MSQFTAAGNIIISRQIPSTLNNAINSILFLSTTMTGHEKGSHKKRKLTRLEVSAEKRRQKKAFLKVTPEAATAQPVLVSQTQESTVVLPDSPTNGVLPYAYCPVPLDGSPTVDNTAIVEMNAGPTMNHDNQKNYC
jgi:hypothetical protein